MSILATIGGFLAPWGTVWMLRPGMLAGMPWPLATIGVHIGDVVLLLAGSMGFVRRWRTDRRRLLFACAVLVAAAITNTFMSADPWASVAGWVRVAAFILAVAGLPYTRAMTRAFLVGFLIAMGVQAGIGIVQFAFQYAPASTILGLAEHAPWVRGDAAVEALGGRWLRAYGGFPHPNVFGTALLIAFIASAALLRAGTHRWTRVIGYWPLMICAFVLSFSRAALLGLLMFLVALAFRRATRTLAAVSALVLVLAIGATWPLWMSRVNASGRIEARSTTERITAFADARSLIAAAPVFGSGLHAMPQVLIARDPTRSPYAAQPVHNALLLALVEVGVVGVLLLAIALFLLVPCSAFRVSHSAFVFALLPPLLLDHFFWSLAIGPVLVFTFAVVWSWDTVDGREVLR